MIVGLWRPQPSRAAVHARVPRRRALPAIAGRTTREALVRSAAELFVEEGYGAVSVRDLARQTHLTSGAIYGHFRNKADLLVAAIADRIAVELEGPQGKANNFSSYIGRQWRTYRSRTAMRALLVEGAAAARVDDDVRDELSELLSTKLDEWRAIYHEVQIDEKMDPDVDMDTVVVDARRDRARTRGPGVDRARPPQAGRVGAHRGATADVALSSRTPVIPAPA